MGAVDVFERLGRRGAWRLGPAPATKTRAVVYVTVAITLRTATERESVCAARDCSIPRSDAHACADGKRQRRPSWGAVDRCWTWPIVEARGIEPRSEARSTTSTTCVSHRLISPTAGQWAAHRKVILLEFRSSTEGASPS